ncbi:MAG: hypothetical protein ABI665_15150 [Vicinamibacterales bacterium]
MSGGLQTLWGRQPVLILAFVQATLAMFVGFGLRLSGDQVALVMTFSAAFLGVITASQVTPVATLPPPIAAAVLLQKFTDQAPPPLASGWLPKE